MTVSSSTSKVVGLGNGVTTAWPFSFKVLDEDHLEVTYTDADDVETLLASGYTVSLNADQEASPGGTVTYSPAIASGTKLTIARVLPVTQPTDLQNQGGYYPEVLEQALDQLIMVVQQLDERVSRAVLAPISSDAEPDDLIAELTALVAAATAAAVALTNLSSLIYTSSSAPSTPGSGYLWRDTTGGATDHRIKMWDGTDWISLISVNVTANTAVPYLGGVLTLHTDGLTFSGDTDTGIYRAGANDLRLKSKGTDWGRVTEFGFGVGAAAPDVNTPLYVELSQDARTSAHVKNPSTGASARAGFRAEVGGSGAYIDYSAFYNSGSPYGVEQANGVGTIYKNADIFALNPAAGTPEYGRFSPTLGAKFKNTLKAWAVVDLTGTMTIIDSFNLTSVTDNATGDFTCNFTTAFADALYGMVGGGYYTGGVNYFPCIHTGTARTTTACRIAVVAPGSGALADVDEITVAFMGAN